MQKRWKFVMLLVIVAVLFLLLLLFFLTKTKIIGNVILEGNLIQNSGFESSLASWSAGSYPAKNTGIITISTTGCYSGKCISLSHGDSTWQSISQKIGKLSPNTPYELSAKFKTSQNHAGWVLINSANWKDASCASSPKSFTISAMGNNSWKDLTLAFTIPQKDECGQDASNFNWTVYAYGHASLVDKVIVYYDDISLRQFGKSLTSQNVDSIVAQFGEVAQNYQIEKMSGWQNITKKIENGYPNTTAQLNFISINQTDKKTENYSLVLTGNRTVINTYNIILPAKPSTKYQFSSWIKIKGRQTYNYLVYNYSSDYTNNTPGKVLYSSKGLWSGEAHLTLKPGLSSITETLDLMNINDHSEHYGANSDIDWYLQKEYFETRPGESNITISIELRGFDGSLLVDNISVQEVDSFIDDSYLRVPIKTKFGGMEIKTFSQSPLFIETNAGKFSFSDHDVTLEKDGEILGKLEFGSKFLGSLTSEIGEGYIILGNNNVTFSIGADSSMITKLKNNAIVYVNGNKKPSYSNFEAGIIFATDYNKGILFSPIYSKMFINNMPGTLDVSTRSTTYFNDTKFQERGMKNWEVIRNLSTADWSIKYNFKKGEGFISDIFPPKLFNETESIKNSITTSSTGINQFPSGNYSYSIQKNLQNSNVLLLWMSNYYSNNPNSPKDYWINSSGYPVAPNTPGAKNYTFIPYDVAGPYYVGKTESLKNFVNETHRQGGKVIVYMSPNYYYSNDIDTFLKNLQDNLNEFNLDGVYFDGPVRYNVLKSLELSRKARNLLGDKIYVYHASREITTIKVSNNFRAPFLDAYATDIWQGEAVNDVDDDTWTLNYCGRNVSNTPSVLLGEIRPINYSLNVSENMRLSLTPEQQMDKQLACKGIYRVNPTDTGYIADYFLSGSAIPYNTSLYWNKFYNYSIPVTCNNGVHDTGETLYTCINDAAPKTSEAKMFNKDNVLTCPSTYSIAQWIINGKPFYDAHYTMDGSLIKDDSDNKVNPEVLSGLYYRVPSPTKIDGRGVFEFNSSFVYGNYYNYLNYANSFSSFAIIKTSSTGTQSIFSFNGRHFYGTNNSKIYLRLTNASQAMPFERVISSTKFSGNYAVEMNRGDSPTRNPQMISQVVYGLSVGSYTLSAKFKTGTNSKGYIAINNPSWLDASGQRVGKFIYVSINGTGAWQNIEKSFSLSGTDDFGRSTNGDSWTAYIYSQLSASGDSIYYDDVSLSSGQTNLFNNPGFESGSLTGWSSYHVNPYSEIVGDTLISDNKWHTIGLTYSRPNLKVYVDGIKENETNIELSEFGSNGQFYLGSGGINILYFNGYIDDLFATSETMTAEQVMQYDLDKQHTLSMPATDATCIITKDEKLYSAEKENILCNNNRRCDNDETCSSCSADCGSCYVGGGYGGGGGGCYVNNWSCLTWNACVDGAQTRDCVSNCLTKKTEVQNCTNVESVIWEINSSENESVEKPQKIGDEKIPAYVWYVIVGIFIILVLLIVVVLIVKWRTRIKREEEMSYLRAKEEIIYEAGNFVNDARLRGYTNWQIEKMFRDKGWSDEDIRRVVF